MMCMEDVRVGVLASQLHYMWAYSCYDVAPGLIDGIAGHALWMLLTFTAVL